MHLLLSAGLLATVLGALTQGEGLTRRQTETLNEAQNDWAKDTGTVSDFLSNAASFTGATLVAHATTALNAEKDELNHKAVLDAFFSGANANPLITTANNVLVGEGTFNVVVQRLQEFVDHGLTFTTDDTNTVVGIINEVRCNEVLPAIDQYFLATESVVNNGIQLLAVRPTNCPAGGLKKKSEL
ncbi:hypothetical protein H2200_000467 [Cladophialophora chaetospira]|uniref:Uncharacterized protein n=1 Tax=Cladophialophora chaetospira TaxID=386627 RepID=A0AA39CQZ2_9EURO|nr:hypothetical protein H2200_000467 [Cladophialophora chaetospira]